MESITHIEKLIGGSNIHLTMVPFAMVVDSTFGEIVGGSNIHPTMVPFVLVVDSTFGDIDWRQQIHVDPNKGCHHVD